MTKIYFRENKKTVAYEVDLSKMPDDPFKDAIEWIKKEHKPDDGRILFLVKR